MPDDTLTISCPAKVNLALSVGAPRGDGMHPISSWMSAIDLADTLTIRRTADERLAYEMQVAPDAPRPFVIDWPIEKDLAFRAHALMQQHTRRDLPIELHLLKRVPCGAGLGGGSADAAGVLAGLNDLFSLGLSDAELIQLGMQLGSDVGFMAAVQCGTRSAIVSGTGEHIEALPSRDAMHLALVLPLLHCNTAEVYRAFDRLNPDARVDDGLVRRLADTFDNKNETLFNDLSDAAREVEPQLVGLMDRVQALAGREAHVSGSGAAFFVVAESRTDAESLTAKVASECDVSAIAVST